MNAQKNCGGHYSIVGHQLLADLIPQLLMILFAIGMLYIGLSKGLKPLKVLADEIAKRSPRDLSPIADTYVLTEVRTLTDTINDLLSRMSATIAGQQRFVANAAHQLRTPLAGFSIQVERALREQDIAAIKPALQQMQNSAGRLSHTVNQLLVLAKSEPVDGVNELTQINLVPLIKSTCIDWVPKALQRQTELSFDCSEQSVLVQGDETLLRELLVNLLDNAILYGHDKGHIVVSLMLSPMPVLTIEDNGPGIPESEISKIVERFYRIPGSAGVSCGLGLAIVKEIANLHRANLNIATGNNNSGTKISLAFEQVSQVI
jgi:two-component system, OmpR family, sensor histidine kinase TctE